MSFTERQSLDTMTGPELPTLESELAKTLPHGFQCNVRYVRTPAKKCDALFSALPGQRPERTLLSSHFLTVSVDPAAILPEGGISSTDSENSDVLSFAIEVLVFSTARLTTIFVSKIDSTSYIQRIRPSPIQRTSTTFLQWLAEAQLKKRPSRKVVISLFARAQAQYLFPGSSDRREGHLNKHVLDDRQLIKWWARVLDPIIPEGISPETKYQGFLTVPGYEGNELRRSFMPPSRNGELVNPNWLPGHPLLELARIRGLPEHAPPRCLLPRFPDDPKARYITELDEETGIAQDSEVTASPSKRKNGKWASVRDLKSFWEAMEFRQECSSGRVVGFLWLLISHVPSDDASIAGEGTKLLESVGSASSTNKLNERRVGSTKSAKSAHKSKATKKRRPLSGPIIPRAPRMKGVGKRSKGPSTSPDQSMRKLGEGLLVSQEGYDKTMQTLLNLDFANLPIATRSTRKWVTEVLSICGLQHDFSVSIQGAAKAQSFAPSSSHSVPINDLGNMIKRKRKNANGEATDEHAKSDIRSASGLPPAANILEGTAIRKKPKPS